MLGSAHHPCFRGAPGDSRSRGFSLVELMVVLVISAILMAAGAPAMGAFVRNNRIESQTLELLRTMHFARSEAVKRKTRVILCRSGNPTAATPACGGSSNNWTTGYLLFASGDTNNTFEAGTDALVRVGTGLDNGLTVITNSTSNRNLEYNSDGTTNEGGGTARFAICDKRGGQHGRQINVSPVGRPVLEKGTPTSPVNCQGPT